MKPKSYDDFVYQLFELEQQQLRQQQSTIQTEVSLIIFNNIRYYIFQNNILRLDINTFFMK